MYVNVCVCTHITGNSVMRQGLEVAILAKTILKYVLNF